MKSKDNQENSLEHIPGTWRYQTPEHLVQTTVGLCYNPSDYSHIQEVETSFQLVSLSIIRPIPNIPDSENFRHHQQSYKLTERRSQEKGKCWIYEKNRLKNSRKRKQDNLKISQKGKACCLISPIPQKRDTKQYAWFVVKRIGGHR